MTDQPNPQPEAHAPADPPAPSPTDTAAAYTRWQPLAATIADADTIPMGAADGALAHYNALRGVAAVLPLQAELAAKLPQTNWQAIGQIPDLALAVIQAEALADATAASPTDVKAKRKKLGADRAVMLRACDALADAGHLDPLAVAKVRQGRGAADAAADVGVLTAMLRGAWDKIAGNTALTQQQIDAAAANAKEFLTLFTPDGGHAKPKDAKVAGAQKTRDQLWTLLVNRYEEAEVVGFVKWRKAYAEHVPGLRARKN